VRSLPNSLLIGATWTRVPATDSGTVSLLQAPTMNTAAFPSRNEDFPENLLINWRSHAGCGFNMSTMCLVLHLQVHHEAAALCTRLQAPPRGPEIDSLIGTFWPIFKKGART
jgi:hypothetical protein